MNRRQCAAFFVLIAALLLTVSSSLAAQCQMCRTALTSSVEGQRWAHGINAGIVLLLAVPFLIAVRVFCFIFRPEILRQMRRLGDRLRKASLYVQHRLQYSSQSISAGKGQQRWIEVQDD